MKVYVLIEENSPELSSENGAYDLIGVYKDWNEARDAALKRAESYNLSKYEIVDIFDGRPEGEKIGYSLYLNGDEDNDCWFNIVVEPTEMIE